jgi:hypothetical protein
MRGGRAGAGACRQYNSRFARALDKVAMEAEQLNQIAETLASLRDREAQLRRYL